MDMVRKETPIGESYPGTLGSLSDQLRTFEMQAGSITDYEFVGQKSLGSRLVRLTYVLNFTRLPLLWSFDMYNSSSGWQLIALQFNTDSRSMPFE